MKKGVVVLIVTTVYRFDTLWKLGYFKDLPHVTVRKWDGDKMVSTTYIRVYGGFDIETTTIGEMAFMYHWQLSLYTDKKKLSF